MNKDITKSAVCPTRRFWTPKRLSAEEWNELYRKTVITLKFSLNNRRYPLTLRMLKKMLERAASAEGAGETLTEQEWRALDNACDPGVRKLMDELNITEVRKLRNKKIQAQRTRVIVENGRLVSMMRALRKARRVRPCVRARSRAPRTSTTLTSTTGASASRTAAPPGGASDSDGSGSSDEPPAPSPRALVGARASHRYFLKSAPQSFGRRVTPRAAVAGMSSSPADNTSPLVSVSRRVERGVRR